MASRLPVIFSDTTHFDSDTTTEVTSSLNIIDEEKNRYLSHLDDSMFPLRIPAVVYLAILMVLGFFGNILVLIVYIKKFKPSPTRVFVVCLAVFDLMTCVISIPGEILGMKYSHTFDYPAVCKMIRFNSTFSVVSSGFTLIAVAIERYRKICRPLNKQITIRVARIMVGIAVSVSLVLTIPTVIVYGRKTVKTDKEEITGFECSFDDEWRGTLFPVVYIGVLFLIFFGSLNVLVIMYILIGRTVFNHRRFKFRPAKDKERHSSNNTTETSFKDGSENGIAFRNISSPTTTCNVSSSNNGTLGFDGSSETSCTCRNDTSAQPKTRKVDNSSNSVRSLRNNAANPNKKSRPRAFKTTLMLFIITAVFIISFLPHLILLITRFIKSDFLDSLQEAGFMVYNVFLRSFFIQSAVNCIVYSFCNERFRNEWRKLLVSRYRCGKAADM